MKRVISSKQQPIFSMSKLRNDLASLDRTGDIPEFIYFSEALAGHGPRVKFYGGTKATSRTTDCPSMLISKEHGADRVEILSWHNKKNCPNAWDERVLDMVSGFVDRNLPLLLLVWFQKLDESYLLKYFEGAWSWKYLLNRLTDIPEDIKNIAIDSQSVVELHQICSENRLYVF